MKTLDMRDEWQAAGVRAAPGRQELVGRFAAAILICSLILQRFALPAGEKGVEIVGPAGLLLAALAMYRGAFVIHRARLNLFMLLTLWLALVSAWQAMHPNAYDLAFSINSLLQFLLLNAFCVLSFAEELDEGVFFRWAANILAAVALAGILQFVLQIVGLRFFAFTGLLPYRLLFESGYNLVIPVGIGSLLKANGLVLLEPSIFSQVTAMGLIIEVLAARRWSHICLFGAGLLLSFSGTGWIVLASFLAGNVARLGLRGIAISIGGVAAFAIVAALVSLLSPDVAAVFASRFGEINEAGTSGNLRFVTPYQALDAVWSHESWAWLVGIGAGASEHLDLPFLYTVNTPSKIALDFGIPAVVIYVVLIMRAERTSLQNALVVPAMVLLMFTGGYQQFAPVLFPIFLLLCIARLRPAGVDPA